MAYSNLAKCLIATIVVGGGVTGAVLGTTGSKGNKEERIVSHSSQQDGHIKNPISSEERSVDLFTELKDRKGDLPEEKGQLDQTVNLDEDGPKPLVPAKTPKVLEANSETNSDSPHKNQDLGPKSSVKEGPISEVVSGKEVNYPAPLKENVTPPRKNELKVRTPKRRAERPNLKNKLLAEPKVASQESVGPEEKDLSNKNWFLVKWKGEDELDEFSWSIGECTFKIEGEKVIFSCPWNWESEKIVELHLSLSSDADLTGKKWSDVRELNFAVAGSETSATLGLIFSDNLGKEITIILERKDS